jgi:hypothetical protein
MSRTTKRTKRKKPHNPNRFPAGYSRVISAPLTSEEASKLKNPPMIALDKLRRELADITDLWALWYRVRVSARLSKRFFDDEVTELLTKVESRLYTKMVDLVQGRIEHVILVPNELDELSNAIELSNDIQDYTNRSYQLEEYQRCYKLCLDDMRELEKNTDSLQIKNVIEFYHELKIF